jgi:multiple sugar transport system permease protein
MSTSTPAARLAVRVVGARTREQARQAVWGYVFATPWILGLLLFIVGPMLYTMVLSFTDYNGLSAPKFTGFSNYVKAIVDDELFWPALLKTFYYASVVVPIGIIGSLLCAMMLNQGIPYVNVYRTIFFLPHLTPTVATSVLWLYILHPRMGPVNLLLGFLGVPSPGWLEDTTWAIPSLIIISLWSSLGGNRMLIFLAGLQGVPVELTEAAEIDGASAWGRFWHITIPMISPTIFFNLVLGVIGALKVFGLAFVATRGGPYYATWFIAVHIYQQAFKYYRLGYGCALAWIFALILLVFTYIQVSSSRRWVYYAGT